MQLRSTILTSLIAADLDGKGALDLVYGLRNGELMVIRRQATNVLAPHGQTRYQTAFCGKGTGFRTALP